MVVFRLHGHFKIHMNDSYFISKKPYSGTHNTNIHSNLVLWQAIRLADERKLAKFQIFKICCRLKYLTFVMLSKGTASLQQYKCVKAYIFS